MVPSKSVVFDHFADPTSNGKLGNQSARCKHCGVCVAGSSKASSNFKRHMNKHHPEISLELPATTSDQPRVLSIMHNALPAKWKSTDARQLQLTNSLVKVVAMDTCHICPCREALFCS